MIVMSDELPFLPVHDFNFKRFQLFETIPTVPIVPTFRSTFKAFETFSVVPEVPLVPDVSKVTHAKAQDHALAGEHKHDYVFA
jgi:hypothetical protein